MDSPREPYLPLGGRAGETMAGGTMRLSDAALIEQLALRFRGILMAGAVAHTASTLARRRLSAP